MNTDHLAVKSLDGRDGTLAPDALASLRAQHRGPFLLPGEPGYDDMP